MRVMDPPGSGVRTSLIVAALTTRDKGHLPGLTRVTRDRASVVDPALHGHQPFASAAPLQCHDLRGNADRRLLRRARAEVETDRRRQPRQLVVGEPGLL